MQSYQEKMKGKNGFTYMKRTSMNKLGKWATEVEILATAKYLEGHHNVSQRQMADIPMLTPNLMMPYIWITEVQCISMSY